MALKDWEQIEQWTDYYPSITWAKSRDQWISVWKTGVSFKEMKRRGHNGTFIVSISTSRSISKNKKYFKTKSPALAFAKSYMRSH